MKLITRLAAVIAAAGISVLGVAATAASASTAVHPDGTPSCGPNCVNESSEAYTPDFVLNFNQNKAKGYLVALKQQGNSFSTEDVSVDSVYRVYQLVKAGVIAKSSYAALHYPHHYVFEPEYTPYGVPSGYCAGVARAAVTGEAVSRQVCGESGARTYWVFDPANNGTGLDCLNQGVLCPIVNASDNSLSQPEVLTTGATDTSPLTVEPESVSLGVTADSQMWQFSAGVSP